LKEVRVGKSKVRVGFKGIVNSTYAGVLDMAYTDKAYNFAFENGALTGGIGIDPAAGYYAAPIAARHNYPEIPGGRGLKDVFLYRRLTAAGVHDDRLIAQTVNGHFYYTSVFKTDSWHELPEIIITKDVWTVNYNYNGDDVLLLTSGRDKLIILNDTTPKMCMNTPKFTSLAVHNERVYGSFNGSKPQVWFSDDFNPVNWNVSSGEAGYINFSDECGEVLKVVSFLNYLYVIREYGIFRLTAYGDQSEFLLKKVFTDTGRIVKSSIEVCGDKIIFYAEDGLFAFDGYVVSRIAGEMPKVSRKHIMSGAYLDGCYYLACCIWEDSEENNAIVRYNLRDKSLSVLYGYSVRTLKSVRVHNGAQVLCVFALGDDITKLGMMSESGKVMNVPTQKRYISPYGTLNSSALKTVRSVSLLTTSALTLRVILDGKQYDYQVRGSETMQTVAVEKCGGRIGFELICDSAEAYVTPLIVSLDTVSV